MSCRVAWVPPRVGGDGLRGPGERMDEVFRAEGERAAFDESFDGDAEGVGLLAVEPQFFGDHAGLDRLVAGALHIVQHAAGEIVERHGWTLEKSQGGNYKLPLYSLRPIAA